MTKPIVFMFSGQGSHYYQMGRELFEQKPVFKKWMQVGDDIYRELTGLSIIQELYSNQHKKSDPLTRTLITHPAIFMVEYALGQLLIEHDIVPNVVLGTSLGEFTAAVFAGMLSFETALKAVVGQAQCLEEKCEPGGMLAILHPPHLYEDNDWLRERSELAAINFHSHFVISGESSHLNKIESHLMQQQINFQALAVSHGFHSSCIDAAKSEFLNFIHSCILQNQTLPFISCAHSNYLIHPTPSYFWGSFKESVG